jgi:Ca-activated chloride channel homolog
MVPLFVLAIVCGLAGICRAESVASKNNRGNRLYGEGKYEEAEKAYLSAQGDAPGKPEILYNLGNSLIRQKKYREGMQALGEAISRGDKGTKEKGWYNTGNALFSAGSYKESAGAFIEALKLNPADKDAKHNLELALMKEQEKQQSERNRQQSSNDSNRDKSRGGENRKNGEQQSNQERTESRDQNQQNKKMESQTSESSRHYGTITKQEAMQLLDAMQNQEKEEQRRMLEHRARAQANGKDW